VCKDSKKTVGERWGMEVRIWKSEVRGWEMEVVDERAYINAICKVELLIF